MSVSYPFPPLQSARRHWLNRWWPSTRLHTDPLSNLLIDGRYAPASIANWKLIPSMARNLLAGRVARPLQFTADRRLTVLIPFRDRQAHLERLLPALTATLAQQQIRYRILVVEQHGQQPFNRGKLLNVGMKLGADASDYFCFHDVDAIPVVANYHCPSQPLRLVHHVIRGSQTSVHRDYYFSGAISLRKEQAVAANGFSNEYWGWGKEDDDFFFRLLLADCLCFRDMQGVFEDLPNPAHQQCRKRFGLAPAHVRANRRRRSQLLRGVSDPAADGLSTVRFGVIAQHQQDSYEHLIVQI